MSIGQHTRVGRLKIRVDRVIYTTITLLTVLIIYDGWEELRFWDVVTVIVGPILAIFMGHVFGAALGTRVALGRPLTRHERRAVFVEECHFAGRRPSVGDLWYSPSSGFPIRGSSR